MVIEHKMNKVHSKGFVIGFLTAAGVFIAALCWFLSWHEMRIKPVDVSGLKEPDPAVETVNSYLDAASYALDTRKDRKDMLTIQGWCIIQGRKTSRIAMHILLMDTETGNYFQLPTVMEKRTDVTNWRDDGVNYDNSGFSVHMSGKGLALDRRQYQIKLLYEIDDDRYLIPLGDLNRSE